MRKISTSSFEELRTLKEGLIKADNALVSAVTRGSLTGIQAAVKAGASPLQPHEHNTRPVLLQAWMHPNGEDLVCELLSGMPALNSVRITGAQQVVVHFDQAPKLILQAEGEEEEQALAELAQLLKRSLVWSAAYPPRPDEPTSFVRLRDVNNKLVEAAKHGQTAQVEKALSEGASVLASDAEGKPALVWASEQGNHSQLIGAMLANDPSVSIWRNHVLRNQPNARMIKGGTVPFLATEEAPVPDGHETAVKKEFLTPVLRAHLQTRDDLADEMSELQRFFSSRGVATEIRWPSVVDFQRLLQERFEASLWAVQSEQGLETPLPTELPA